MTHASLLDWMPPATNHQQRTRAEQSDAIASACCDFHSGNHCCGDPTPTKKDNNKTRQQKTTKTTPREAAAAPLLVERVLETGQGKATDGVLCVVHAHGDAGTLKVKDVVILRIGEEHQFTRLRCLTACESQP